MTALVAKWSHESAHFIDYELSVKEWIPMLVVAIQSQDEEDKRQIMFSSAAGMGGIKIIDGKPQGWEPTLVYIPKGSDANKLPHDNAVFENVMSSAFGNSSRRQLGNINNLVEWGIKSKKDAPQVVYNHDTKKYYTYRGFTSAMKRWVNPSDPCEECVSLNDSFIGIDEKFSGDINEPPIHDGCTCTIQKEGGKPLTDEKGDVLLEEYDMPAGTVFAPQRTA